MNGDWLFERLTVNRKSSLLWGRALIRSHGKFSGSWRGLMGSALRAWHSGCPRLPDNGLVTSVRRVLYLQKMRVGSYDFCFGSLARILLEGSMSCCPRSALIISRLLSTTFAEARSSKILSASSSTGWRLLTWVVVARFSSGPDAIAASLSCNLL